MIEDDGVCWTCHTAEPFVDPDVALRAANAERNRQWRRRKKARKEAAQVGV